MSINKPYRINILIKGESIIWASSPEKAKLYAENGLVSLNHKNLVPGSVTIDISKIKEIQ